MADFFAQYPAVPTGGGGGGITQLTGQVLAGPGSGSQVATIAAGVIPRNLTAQWLAADGTTKTITHSWGTQHIMVETLDNSSSYETVYPDVTRPTINTVVLVSSEAPATAWTVLLAEIFN